MASKAIRIGVIGANIHRGWASQSHLPALVASPDFELAAVCTTRRETAAESARAFGARLVFDDYRRMLAHPEIDAAGEVDQMLRFVNDKPYPECIENANQSWGGQYLELPAHKQRYPAHFCAGNYQNAGKPSLFSYACIQ